MADNTYKLIEIVGASSDGVTEAMRNAVNRASKTLKGLDWVEVQQVRGLIKEGSLSEFQVTMKVGFRLMDPEDIKA